MALDISTDSRGFAAMVARREATSILKSGRESSGITNRAALPETGHPMAAHFATVDDYIASFPPDVEGILQEIRRRCHLAVPGAEELVSYNMPTIVLDGKYVVYFAGWKHHISVYPIPVGEEDFERRIEPYRAAKGTLRFPLSNPVPYELIEEVARRLKEQRETRG